MAIPTKLPDKPVIEKPVEALPSPPSQPAWHVPPGLRQWWPYATATFVVVVIAWYAGYYVRGAGAQVSDGVPASVVKEEPPTKTGGEIAEDLTGRGLMLPDRLAIWLFGKDDKVKVEILEKGDVQDGHCEIACQVTAASRTEPLAMAAVIIVQYRKVKSRWYIQDLAILSAEVEDRRPPKKETSDKPEKPDK